jgi:ankyrin repeat protein
MDVLHADLFHSDAIYGEGDVAYRHAQILYATAYNREIVSHPSVRFSDVCRLRSADESDQYDQSYLSLSAWLVAAEANRHDGTLASAARLGDRRAVQELLDAGSDPNQSDIWAITPLAWAALRGDVDVARALLTRGADASLSCEACATPLNLAVIGGSEDVIALLISAGAVIDADSDGLQPHSDAFPRGAALWVATVLGRHAILDQLIRAGANPNIITGMDTAALRAIVRKDPTSLRMLLAAGGDPNAHTQGVSLIQAAAALDFPEGVRALLNAGASAEARSDFEERMWRLASEHDRDPILLRLIGNGAHLHLLPRNERAAIADAIEDGDEETVARLLSKADRRWDELRGAITAGDLAEVRGLIARGAGVMRGHGEGELIVAIESGQRRIVEWLLANGTDPTAPAHPDSARWLRTNSDRAPDWQVTDRGSVFGRVPYQYHAQTSPAHLAFNTGPIEIVDIVLDGVEPDDRNVTLPGDAYLDDAFRGYRRHRDQRILERARTMGGPPAFTGPQADQFLADICTWTGDDAPRVLESYLEMGYRPRGVADPPHQALYPSDDPALSQCIVASDAAALLLLEYGADPDQPNSIGESALWEALSGLHSSDASTQFLTRLLSAGADPNASESVSPLRYAIARSQAPNAELAHRFQEATALLRSHGAQDTQAQVVADERPVLPIR